MCLDTDVNPGLYFPKYSPEEAAATEILKTCGVCKKLSEEAYGTDPSGNSRELLLYHQLVKHFEAMVVDFDVWGGHMYFNRDILEDLRWSLKVKLGM